MNQRIKISANTTVATIDIEGEIGSEQSGAVTTYGALKEKLQQIEELEAPVVVVNIRSVGGDVAYLRGTEHSGCAHHDPLLRLHRLGSDGYCSGGK